MCNVWAFWTFQVVCARVRSNCQRWSQEIINANISSGWLCGSWKLNTWYEMKMCRIANWKLLKTILCHAENGDNSWVFLECIWIAQHVSSKLGSLSCIWCFNRFFVLIYTFMCFSGSFVWLFLIALVNSYSKAFVLWLFLKNWCIQKTSLYWWRKLSRGIRTHHRRVYD